MVYINKLEISGFKSFGFKNTVIHFQPGLISISGPNGSGKSNILDAIIFALGENKPKMMRVDKLQSLIHDMNKNKHGVRTAKVNVHFDNTDKKLPIESTIVVLTRELNTNGDSLYYINHKKITRTKFLDMLDVSNTSLNPLNAIQQGTVTRISEFTTDETRKSIENLIGLSYFDDKKDNALKQLEESDRKLEISLARMDEIKKRINELEFEMNLKNRYEFLQDELNYLNAITVTNKLKKIKNNIILAEQKKSFNIDKKLKLENSHMRLKLEIGNIKFVKSQFMKSAKTDSMTKTSIDNKLKNTIQKFEAINSEIIISNKQLNQTNKKIPIISDQILQLDRDKARLSIKISNTSNLIKKINNNKQNTEQKINNINKRISQLVKYQNIINKDKINLDNKIQKLNDDINKINLQLTKLCLNYNFINNKLNTDNIKQAKLNLQSKKLNILKQKLNYIIINHRKKIGQIAQIIINDRNKYNTLQNQLLELTSIITLSNQTISKYDTRINILKKILHEDYTFAKLTESTINKSGILGIVKNLFTWAQKYERPILAACSNILKAVVVKDLETLLSISKIIYHENLPRLKIIPINYINEHEKIPSPSIKTIGTLDDFITCSNKLNSLKKFLFGSFILVNSQKTAISLSKKGYKVVTMNGEYFNKGNIIIIDSNSKIFNLEKIITIGSSTSSLNKSIFTLQKLISNIKLNMNNINITINKNQNELSLRKLGLNNATSNYLELIPKISNMSDMLVIVSKQIASSEEAKQNIANQISKLEIEITKCKTSLTQIQKHDISYVHNKITEKLEEYTTCKSTLITQQNNLMRDYNEQTTLFTKLTSSFHIIISKINTLKNEKNFLTEYKFTYTNKILLLKDQKNKTHKILINLRQTEQSVISESSLMISKITEFDKQLSDSNKNEQSTIHEINKLERKIDSINRDISDLQKTENNLFANLSKYGEINTNIDLFDAEPIIHALNSEKNSLQINAKAIDSYLNISHGYRSMSERKNELEQERNSIIYFIESIEKEKRQTFLNAFDIIDKEIKLIFSKMTNGHAWLELQNEDDIFSSGISYLVQFPNKPKRDTTSISGGEKTLAAIVFVLALQKLKPSPFYLFDEIDAHLDSPNSEKLSQIIKEKSYGSQFIMVSLKDSIIEKAELIYGVYPKNGISNLITYKKSKSPIIE